MQTATIATLTLAEVAETPAKAPDAVLIDGVWYSPVTSPEVRAGLSLFWRERETLASEDWPEVQKVAGIIKAAL